MYDEMKYKHGMSVHALRSNVKKKKKREPKNVHLHTPLCGHRYKPRMTEESTASNASHIYILHIQLLFCDFTGCRCEGTKEARTGEVDMDCRCEASFTKEARTGEVDVDCRSEASFTKEARTGEVDVDCRCEASFTKEATSLTVEVSGFCFKAPFVEEVTSVATEISGCCRDASFASEVDSEVSMSSAIQQNSHSKLMYNVMSILHGLHYMATMTVLYTPTHSQHSAYVNTTTLYHTNLVPYSMYVYGCAGMPH